MTLACFVTGTDTGVGKTRVSAALLRALHRAGHARVVGMKPVAAGCDWVEAEEGRSAHWLNDDVAALRAAHPGGAAAVRQPLRLAITDCP